MPQILSTIGSSHKIEQVITEAKQYIVIVTPYLKITQPIMSRLIQADRRGIKIILLYGKDELNKALKEALNALSNLNLYFLKDLHAKCYLNENLAILSSMNLYEYSQVNNWEIGISITEEDTVIKDQVCQEVDLMLLSSSSKIENFKLFPLVKKEFAESLMNYLNKYFETDKFKYEKTILDQNKGYFESLYANGYPIKQINIKINKTGSSTEFNLIMNKSQLINLQHKLNFSDFSDEYRIYNDRPGKISIYYSKSHSYKWTNYNDLFKFEYVAKGIKEMIFYLTKIIEENK